jgi:hypothetical protein
MLRRLVARRVYVGEAVHGEHVRRAAHAAIVDEGLWAAANRVTPAVRSDAGADQRRHEDSLLRGLLRCSGCRYALKRMPQPEAPPRWRCRTLLTERSATHMCDSPAAITSRQSPEAEQTVIDAFMRLASGVGVEPAAVENIAELERRAQEAEALLDELSSLEVRATLGATRWGKLIAEARDSVEWSQHELATARAQSRTIGTDRITLEQAWADMTLPEQQDALRSIVQAVMVDASGAVEVVPVWVEADLPRKGAKDFSARPWA